MRSPSKSSYVIRMRSTGAYATPAPAYGSPPRDGMWSRAGRMCSLLMRIRAFTAAEPDSLMTRALGLSMLRTDGEDHQRQRRAAHLVLRVKEFEACWSGMLVGVADELLDEIEEAGRADLVRDFAGPYAARTLKLMLGLDDVADTNMQIWSQALIDGVGNYADDASVWRRCQEAGAGIDAAVARARDHAREGTVIHAMLSDEAVTYDEVLANVKLFISGGLNEPRDVIATTTWALLRDPEQAALVRADPIAFAAATEESLRWMSPIAMYPRYVSSDTRLDDVELAAGRSHRSNARLSEQRRAALEGARPFRSAEGDPAACCLLARTARLPGCVRRPAAGQHAPRS